MTEAPKHNIVVYLSMANTSPEFDQTIESLHFENIAAVPAFYELVDLATEVCLNNPDRVQEYYLHNRTLSDLKHDMPNVWSARGVMEYAGGTHKSKVGEEDSLDPLLHISPEDVMGNPEWFGPKPITEVLDLANAFGEALLDEAFECLGPDAPDMVKQWQTGTSEHAKTDTIAWLENRIHKIQKAYKEQKKQAESVELIDILDEAAVITVGTVRTDISQDAIDNAETITVSELLERYDVESAVRVEEENPYFYHPARLSPKFMGKYPDIKTDPTCLAISILSTAFFRKAGARVLHAGVMRTATHEIQRALKLAGEDLAEFAQNHEIELPDAIARAIEYNTKNYETYRDRQGGYHAATLVEIDDDCWALLDPNYDRTTLYKEIDATNLSKRHTILNLTDRQMGGVDVTFAEAFAELPTIYIDVMERANTGALKPEEAGYFLDQLLVHPDPRALLRDYVRTALLGDAPYDKPGHSALSAILQYHEGMATITMEDQNEIENILGNLEAYVDKLIDSAINNYVSDWLFPDDKPGDFEKSLERCRTDLHYKQRRQDDLSVLPQLVTLRLLSMAANNMVNNKLRLGHSYLEVGHAATRVGMCVLSDFASHCGDDLPATFWTSHWSSGISLNEHALPKINNPGQYKVARNIAKILETSWLTYAKDGVKIGEFLKQGATFNP